MQKSEQFKTVFNGGTSYVTQLKKEKNYICNTSP